MAGEFRLPPIDSKEGYGIVCSTMHNKNNFPCHLLILNHLSLFGGGGGGGGGKIMRMEILSSCCRLIKGSEGFWQR